MRRIVDPTLKPFNPEDYAIALLAGADSPVFEYDDQGNETVVPPDPDKVEEEDLWALLPPAQPKQQEFININADFTLYGGAAGSGKTFSLLLAFSQPELLKNPNYHAVIFRRTFSEINKPGALWSKSCEIFPLLGGVSNKQEKKWTFPSGATISFSHLQYESDIYSWQGAEVQRVGYDECTHFSATEVFYLLTRMRSPHGIRSQLRATCNPDAESWLAQFISWWLNPQGYPYPERSGVIRWFVRLEDDEFDWADTPEELRERHPNAEPKSFTFVSAKITDNPALLDHDPDYLGNLKAQNEVERARLLDGNWRVKKSEAKLFPVAMIGAGAYGEWEEPSIARSYLCGVDPNFGGSNDFCCQMWDITEPPFSLVDEFSEADRAITYSTSRSSRMIAEFNPVLVAVEKNSGGLIVLERLIELHPGVRIEPVNTSTTSKLINTDRIAIALVDGRVKYPSDWKGVEQMRKFSKETREAITGKDDSIMAWAVAFAWLEEARRMSIINPMLFT